MTNWQPSFSITLRLGRQTNHKTHQHPRPRRRDDDCRERLDGEWKMVGNKDLELTSGGSAAGMTGSASISSAMIWSAEEMDIYEMEEWDNDKER